MSCHVEFIAFDYSVRAKGLSHFSLQSHFWPDCKAIPAYGLMMSVCLSTFWLTSAFKFVISHINQYKLDTLHGNRPW